jgi:translation initiation factor IF-3
LNRPQFSRNAPPSSYVRVDGKIRAREVRVIGPDGSQIGILSLADAISLARKHQLNLVEVASSANPPVCRIIDFGKYRYEQAKKEKESKKHQHANKVKEVQLSANIDPHDFGVKLQHAVEFLCDDMKVKISLRFRGREMAHQEFGFRVVQKFIADTTPFGHPDSPAKLTGRSINVMLSPLPRNKRAKNPYEKPAPQLLKADRTEEEDDEEDAKEAAAAPKQEKRKVATNAAEQPGGNPINKALSNLELPKE